MNARPRRHGWLNDRTRLARRVRRFLQNPTQIAHFSPGLRLIREKTRQYGSCRTALQRSSLIGLEVCAMEYVNTSGAARVVVCATRFSATCDSAIDVAIEL